MSGHRHPPRSSPVITWPCPQARGGDHPRCPRPGPAPQHRRGRRTRVQLIKCPMSRHLIGPVGPRQCPFAGASPRRLNYARGPATRVADGGTRSNQSPWQVGSQGGHTPGAPLPVSRGAEDTQSPSQPGSRGEGRSLHSSGLGGPSSICLCFQSGHRVGSGRHLIVMELRRGSGCPKEQTPAPPGEGRGRWGVPVGPSVSWERCQPSWVLGALVGLGRGPHTQLSQVGAVCSPGSLTTAVFP